MEHFTLEEPIACIIFDCDGTLVDSEQLSHQALVATFASFGVAIDLQESLDHFEGGKLTDVLRQTCERYAVQLPIDQLEPRYRTLCHQLFEQSLQPTAGIEEVLKTLATQGIEMCVASNGPTEKMAHALTLTGLMPYFENRLFSAFDTNSWKPAPDLLHYAAMNMACPSQQCIFIDDTNRGIQAGINANMRTIHFNANPNALTTTHPLVHREYSAEGLRQLFSKAYVAISP